MGFETLRFFNFRNLADAEVRVDARDVFLVGENGQGKTNFLEAVHLLTHGSSFREKREAAFHRDPHLSTGLSGRYVDAATGATSLSLRMESGRRREISVDERPLSDRRELLTRVLCICLVQQDMEFVSGPPEERRRFFDQTLLLSDPSFLETLRGYRQVLRARNLCLREDRNDLLDIYDVQLAGLGLALQARRAALVEEFDTVFAPLFREIAGQGDGVRIRYRPSWEALRGTDEVVAHLGAQRERDRKVGTTTTGPHRDSCVYIGGGREYVPYASTGQLRLCALSLRVAQAQFLAARTGRKPVLLLDDVLLELDPRRKSAFFARFPPYEQAFCTFLPDESWQAYRATTALVLSVEQGVFRR